MDCTVCQHILGAGRISFHMVRTRMRPQRLHAFPFLDYYKRILPERRLHRPRIFSVDCRFISNATVLGQNCRHISIEQVQHSRPLASFGGDYSDDMNE